MRREEVRYGDGLIGLAIWDGDTGPRPGVLVAPTVMGHTALEERRAADLVGLGYGAFILDVYGKGRPPAGFDEALGWMAEMNADRRLLLARLRAALESMRARPEVDAARTAAIGYCFGGKCVLDLARSGAEVAGVVSFHGLFDPPPYPTAARIVAKVLALHGWDDPLATPDAALAFAAELTKAGADWQLHAYGHTVHAFTNPGRPEMYSAAADRRSWAAMQGFLTELFG